MKNHNYTLMSNPNADPSRLNKMLIGLDRSFGTNLVDLKQLNKEFHINDNEIFTGLICKTSLNLNILLYHVIDNMKD